MDENIGNDSGWLGFTYKQDDVLTTTLTLSGYPGSHQYYQYMASGIALAATDYYILHQIDATGGQSGSPLFNSDLVVYGVESNTVEVGTRNRAVRITEEVYNYLRGYKNAY
ncbi:MAG: hypothetical protein IJX39_00655 [Clostridia bacterium]|nr:hypothetical protein [Clostridia bacterium]